MIKPKDGEWWMVEFQSGDKRVMRYWLRDGDSDAVWNVFHDESDSFTTAHSTVKPLYKMVKAEEPKPRTKVVHEKDNWESGDDCICDGECYTYLCESPFDGDAVIALCGTLEWSVISVSYERLKTPEQNKRDEFIIEIESILNSKDMGYCSGLAGAIYDAGYRKPE